MPATSLLTKRLGRKWLLTRERQEPLCDGRHTLGPVNRRVDEPCDVRLPAGELPLQEAEAPQDDGKHIVELVGYAPRELPDRLHLMDLTKLLLDLRARFNLLENALFEGVVQDLKGFFGSTALRHLLCRGLIETGVIDCGGDLTRNAG